MLQNHSNSISPSTYNSTKDSGPHSRRMENRPPVTTQNDLNDNDGELRDPKIVKQFELLEKRLIGPLNMNNSNGVNLNNENTDNHNINLSSPQQKHDHQRDHSSEGVHTYRNEMNMYNGNSDDSSHHNQTSQHSFSFDSNIISTINSIGSPSNQSSTKSQHLLRTSTASPQLQEVNKCADLHIANVSRSLKISSTSNSPSISSPPIPPPPSSHHHSNGSSKNMSNISMSSNQTLITAHVSVKPHNNQHSSHSNHNNHFTSSRDSVARRAILDSSSKDKYNDNPITINAKSNTHKRKSSQPIRFSKPSLSTKENGTETNYKRRRNQNNFNHLNKVQTSTDQRQHGNQQENLQINNITVETTLSSSKTNQSSFIDHHIPMPSVSPDNNNTLVSDNDGNVKTSSLSSTTIANHHPQPQHNHHYSKKSKSAQITNFFQVIGKKSAGFNRVTNRQDTNTMQSENVTDHDDNNDDKSNQSMIVKYESQIKQCKIELDQYKEQISLLTTALNDKEAQLKAVSNNHDIRNAQLSSRLQQYEDKMKKMNSRAEISMKKLQDAIEVLVRKECKNDQNSKRQKLASDGARLGRWVYTRIGMRTEPVWEDGDVVKELNSKKHRLKWKKESLEKQLKDDMGNQNVDPGHESFEREVFEQSILFHLEELEREAKGLQQEEDALRLEKAAHKRELRRVANEDGSRFKHRPKVCLLLYCIIIAFCYVNKILIDFNLRGKLQSLHKKLHDRYIPLCQLGKGGFSEVWRAYDLFELREVAVKIHQLDPRWSDAKIENYTKHVTREYEIHRGVRHPRIVSLYGVFEIDKDAFATVLECCNGTDLDTLLQERKRLPERHARAILLQILSGMKYLSTPSKDNKRPGIIHYDLKPGNILFDEFGNAKITDFGLSKIMDSPDPAESMELTSQGAGTYWYLPPECFVTSASVRIT